MTAEIVNLASPLKTQSETVPSVEAINALAAILARAQRDGRLSAADRAAFGVYAVAAMG